MKKKTLTALGLIFALNAHAANWMLAASDESEKMFIDIASIKANGGLFLMWQKVEYNLPRDAYYTQSDSSIRISTLKKYSKVVKKVLVNCATSEEKVFQQTYFFFDNTSQTRKETTGEFNEVIPDSINEKGLRFICSKRSKEKRIPPQKYKPI